MLCGHIHQPEIKTIVTEKGKVEYLNSGDWVENLTALEYTNNSWSLFQYNDADFEDAELDSEDELVMMNDDAIFKQMLSEFLITTTT